MTDFSLITSNLEQMANGLRDQASQSLRKVSEMVADEARRVLGSQLKKPTGNLENSMVVNGTEDALAFEVTASAPYAAFVEYGTSRQTAKPFMTSAMTEMENEMLGIMAADLAAELR